MARTEVTGRQIKDKSVSLTDDVIDVLPVANGGSGLTTLASGSVLVGAGTNPVEVVYPGTNGNVLTSNGSTWVSAPGATGAAGATGASGGTGAPGASGASVDDVVLTGTSFQFYTGTVPIGDPISLLVTVLDGGTPSSTSTGYVDGGTL